MPLERLAEDDSIRSWGDLFGGFMELYAAERGRPRWGYKTPGNELHADAIFGAFPDARLIQMVRDPRDVAVSFRAAGGGTWAYDPEAHRRDWRASVEAGIAGQERWPGQWMVVRYEDLVADREAVMRAVCGFCGLDFNPAVLEGRAHPGWTGENSSFDSAGSRADRDPDFVGRLEPIYDADLGRLMRSLGYPVDAAGVTEDRRLRSARASVVKPLARAVIDAMTA